MSKNCWNDRTGFHYFYRLVKIAVSRYSLKLNLDTSSEIHSIPANLGSVDRQAANEGAIMTARAAKTQRRTRIQKANEQRILDAALDVFSLHGFRGATIDQIAQASGMSKPNLLYYFRTKDAIHGRLIAHLLETWLDPLREMDENGDPVEEIRHYIRRKIDMARDYPRESRLFANEILQGAPHIESILKGPLRKLVGEKAKIIQHWIADGKLAECDPHHLIFSIWATTQHYADFDVQVRAVLGEAKGGDGRFDDAARFLEFLYFEGLRPDARKHRDQRDEVPTRKTPE